MNARKLIFTVIIMMIGACASSQTLRYIDNTDGLSNSSVISLMQDKNGIVWIGTCDGLNSYDGNSVIRFNKHYYGHDIDGSIISGVYETSDGNMWIQSNYGLHKYSGAASTFNYLADYPEYKGKSEHSQIYASDNKIYLVKADGGIYYNEGEGEELQRLDCLNDFKGAAISNLRWSPDNVFEIVTQNGISTVDLKKNSSGKYSVEGARRYIPANIVDSYRCGDDIWVMDTDGNLRYYDRNLGNLSTVANLKNEIASRNVVTSVCTDNNGNVLVGFKSEGLLKIKPDGVMEDMGIRVGIFTLMPDRNQNIIWIGTDGQGVIECVNTTTSMSTILYHDLFNTLYTPTRALYINDNNTLYIGTKGDGILCIDDYTPGKSIYLRQLQRITSANSALLDNSVYVMSPYKGDGIWVGSESGINYFNTATKKMMLVENHPDELMYIHALVHENDSTLWAASLGKGVYKITIDTHSPTPRFKKVENFVNANGETAANYFFALVKGADGSIYAGNRGYGVFKCENHKLVPQKIGEASTLGHRINEVYSFHADADGTLWTGTSDGLLRHNPDGTEKLYNESFGLPNGYIHSVQRINNDLWLGTNAGLVRFIPETEKYQVYKHKSGVDIVEYSDGAVFERDGLLLIGGTKGIVCVQTDGIDESASTGHSPEVLFRKLFINGTYNIFNDRVRRSGKNAPILELDYTENNISIEVAATDYVNAENLVYLYKLSDDDKWLTAGSDNQITFTHLDPGNYDVQIKYLNTVSGVVSDVSDLKINITPPWYLSIWSKLIYFIFFISIVSSGFFYLKQRNELQQQRNIEKLEQEHNAEIYENKLKFFTNITHEFCTPLTLIYGPCERLLSYEKSDPYIRRYVNLIKNNAERMNGLIQELIDFRRLETGHRELNVSTIDISAMSEEIIESFKPLAEQNGVKFEYSIQPLVLFDTDKNSLKTIIYNLISNAFKYAPFGGLVKVVINTHEGKLHLSVYNTGKGFTEEQKSSAFNRYEILDNLEANATKGLSARNGLGLAICYSMVEFLGGTIEIESEPDKYAEFIVELPSLPVTTTNPASPDISIEHEIRPDMEPVKISDPLPATPSLEIGNDIGTKGRILVVDDDLEILVLLREGLEGYSITTATTAKEAMEKIQNSVPDLIITDVMMPEQDGISFVKELKDNPYLLRVPVIVFSAKHSDDDYIKALHAGADAYVPKPFKFDYMRAVIERLLKRNEQMQDYYSSSAVAYQYSGGKLQSSDDKILAEKVAKFIEDNIDNDMLNAEMIAEHVCMSLRNLYHRFKKMGHIPPNEFIKERRLTHAAHLLVTTTMNIKDVVIRCGFNNRSHFYKEFAKKYGMLPTEYRKSKQINASEWSEK